MICFFKSFFKHVFKCVSKHLFQNILQLDVNLSVDNFMFNQFNLMQLGYIINVNKLDLNSLIKMVCNNQDAILNYNSNTKNDKKIGQTLFQSLFSLSDYLKQINIKNQFSSLQNQSK